LLVECVHSSRIVETGRVERRAALATLASDGILLAVGHKEGKLVGHGVTHGVQRSRYLVVLKKDGN